MSPSVYCGPYDIWNLCMDVLLDQLCATNTKCVAYADDLVLIVEGETRVEIESKSSTCMRVVYD